MTGNTEAGLRAVLYEEFTDIWAFDMRGNQKGVKGDVSRKEGGKIFGSGSTQPTMMLLLVKNKSKMGKCTIHYHDIGNYLSREQKLEKIREMKSIVDTEWTELVPNEDHDWLNQRDPQVKKDYLTKCMPMGIRKSAKKEPAIFEKFSQGITTSRDAWVYNTSLEELESNMKKTISHCANIDVDNPDKNPKFVHMVGIKSDLENILKNMRPKKPQFIKNFICLALYRPFIKHYLYLDKGMFVSRPRNIPKFFPDRSITDNNYKPPSSTPPPIILCSGKADNSGYSSASGRSISRRLQTDRLTHSGERQNEHHPTSSGQDDQIHSIYLNTAAGLGGGTPQPGIPITEGGNLTIMVPDKIKTRWSVFISDLPPDLHIHDASQAFPLVTYGGRID